MERSTFVSGKIILAGEYAVVFGHPGLAMPVAIGISAIFEEDKNASGLMIDQTNITEKGKAFIATVVAMAAAEHGDALRGTLHVHSAIPIGKGMGSSTALVIAITRVLLGEGNEAAAKKIEDAINPGHSGIDFAVIWNATPLRFVREKEMTQVTLTNPLFTHAVLIDTGEPNQATPELVAWVKERQQELQKPLDVIGGCADRLLRGESPLTVFKDHHAAQVALGVVPEKAQALIAEIEQAGGAAKVIGAGGRTGGAGMVLAVHPEHEKLTALTKEWPVLIL